MLIYYVFSQTNKQASKEKYFYEDTEKYNGLPKK